MPLSPHGAPDGFDRVLRMVQWHADPARFTARLETAAGAACSVIVEALPDDVWHYVFLPPGTSRPDATPMVSAPPPDPVPLTVSPVDGGVSIEGPGSAVRIDGDPWCARFLDRAGREILRENPFDVDGFGRPFILPLGFVHSENAIRLVTQTFHLYPDERLYGLGEKFTPLDKSRQRIVAWNLDAFGSTSERSHKNVPLLISSRGYGLFLDSTVRVTWELGTVSCQSYTIAADQPTLDLYVFAGGTPADILRRYADLTGHAPVPPRWTFGLWVSSGGTYRDRKSVEELVEGLEKHDVPADVVHVDPWWMTWRHYCDFIWEKSAFPDAGGFIADLHRRSLRLCLWEHPYISVESPLFEVAAQRGFLALRPEGGAYVMDYGLSRAPRPDGLLRAATPDNSWNARVGIVDLTNPDACRWYQDLHRPLLRSGVDVFKTDFGEDIPADAVFHNGETGATVHNLYPLLYNRAVFEVTEQEHGTGIVWGRSGTAGSQRYPVCWSGDPAADFDSLACTIRGGLSAGLSGIPFWSNDIGGYRGKPDEELYVRWAQFGLFCSHSRMHGDSPREPWAFGARALSIVRKYIGLRYELFPYLYSTAFEAGATGMPVIRAMPLVFPADPNACDKDLQFLVGPWLLVAPVCERTTRKTVYLPGGTWMDYWSGVSLPGPCTVEVPAPLDTLPMFVRAGAIVPKMLPARRIPAGLIDPLVVDLYPAADSAYRFREDEGTTGFHCGQKEGLLTFRWEGGPRRSMMVRVHSAGPFRVESLEADGAPAAAPAGPVEERWTLISIPACSSGVLVLRKSSA